METPSSHQLGPSPERARLTLQEGWAFCSILANIRYEQTELDCFHSYASKALVSANGERHFDLLLAEETERCVRLMVNGEWTE